MASDKVRNEGDFAACRGLSRAKQTELHASGKLDSQKWLSHWIGPLRLEVEVALD